MFAQPSAEVPARARRTNPDESRRLAHEVIHALCDAAPVAAARIEHSFLDHCISCQDKLAFMLAVRELRKQDIWLGERWTRAEHWLQQHQRDGQHKAEPDTRSTHAISDALPDQGSSVT